MVAITLRHIAEMLGTTQATVSRALSDDERISTGMKQRVLKAVKDTGYRPSALARGLKGVRTQTLGILWSLTGPHASTAVVRRMAITAMRRGYVTYIADSLSDPKIMERALEDFLLRGVDGVILQWDHPTPLPDVARRLIDKFPVAVIVTNDYDDLGVNFVMQDRLEAIRDVARHFVKTGRRHPAAFMTSINNASLHKSSAFVDAARQCGVEVEDRHLFDIGTHDGTAVGGAFKRTFEQAFPTGSPTFDSVFCSTDEGAAALIQLLNARGLKVPDDVAVVGFNDSDFAKFTIPPLATIDRCDAPMIKVALEMLFSQLDNGAASRRCEAVPMKFVWRESAG